MDTNDFSTDLMPIEKEISQRHVSPEPLSKSTEVVQWQPMQSSVVLQQPSSYLPVNFLQMNTNLNLPPPNWLRATSKVEESIQPYAWTKERSDFASFNMAHGFPDDVGEVDVISDAENIKTLLKVPYSNTHVSMMVHRVGKTLLLDDFDLHKHLLRQEQSNWEWLGKFYHETVLRNMEDKLKCVPKKNKSRDYLRMKNMYSKFLYYSVANTEEPVEVYTEEQVPVLPRNVSTEQQHDFSDLLQLMPDPLPEPLVVKLDKNGICSGLEKCPFAGQEKTYFLKFTTGMPGSVTDPVILAPHGEFHRAVRWTFEDIKMLIGTDLPIFQAGHHPCVSVRLRDMEKPVNILTGLDYWLDNLMCNVPELAMCFHINGIVQTYELYKTEDIPNSFADSIFTPQVVADTARNILAFLKTNATKEGHTYWLYKGVDADVIKLYDLTTLCADSMEDRSQNPFTVPLGMLLYRVARNMLRHKRAKQSGVINTLLATCLLLLDEHQPTQVCTSANYLLADLYVPDSVVKDTRSLSSSDESDSEFEETDDQDDEVDEQTSTSVEVQALCIPNELTPSVRKSKQLAAARYQPVCGSVEERCREALKYIQHGLESLDTDIAYHLKKAAHEQAENQQVPCNPAEAIPLHYEPISKRNIGDKQSQSTLNSAVSEPSSTSQNFHSDLSLATGQCLPVDSWHYLSKILLLRKAAMVYYGLASVRTESSKYGAALKLSKLSLMCFEAMKQLSSNKGIENKELLAVTVSLVADLRLMITHSISHMDVYQEQYSSLTEQDLVIQDSALKELQYFEFKWMCELTSDLERNLKDSGQCYETARDLFCLIRGTDSGKLAALNKRLGNLKNELGIFYMNYSMTLSEDKECVSSSPPKAQEDLWKLSYCCFDTGVQAFESIADRSNQALLYLNMAKLMRICAQGHANCSSGQQRHEFNAAEKHYYNKAIDFYQRALDVLSEDGEDARVRESVLWELSSTYFNMAVHMQDYAPFAVLNPEQVEREVIDLMHKSLKYCNADKTSPRQAMYQYRLGTVNYRLASLYHNSYRNLQSDQKKKYLKQLASNHYEKSVHYYSLTESWTELLRAQLERVALCEFQLTTQAGVSSKLKLLEMGLHLLLECHNAVRGLGNEMSETKQEEGTDGEKSLIEISNLVDILQSRLLFILHTLVKQHSERATKKRDVQLERVKQMYSVALRGDSTDKIGIKLDVNSKCDRVWKVLSTLRESWMEMG